VNGYTDAATHLAGAKYWIPTLDEWLKAAYYDPNRYGHNVPGWWAATNRSDIQGISGLPGVGTTSAGLTLPGAGEWTIPLGAYPQSLSPWGLLDTSGGAAEFTEEWASVDRRLGGAAAGLATISELISFPFLNDDPQGASGFAGLRIASVPTPGTLMLPCLLVLIPRRRSTS
jgi:formylglycine-generating enzyme required for sulfatase activity